MALNLERFTTTIRNWVKNALNFDDTRVLTAWAKYQGGGRPAGGPFVTVSLLSMTPTYVAGTIEDFDADRPAGSEFKITSVGNNEFSLRIQCYGGGIDDSTSAIVLLNKLLERLSLPSVRETFDNAEMSIFEHGTVKWIPGIEGTKFEGRAIVDIRGYVDASESEYAGYVEQVEVTDKGVTPPDTFIVSTGE